MTVSAITRIMMICQIKLISKPYQKLPHIPPLAMPQQQIQPLTVLLQQSLGIPTSLASRPLEVESSEPPWRKLRRRQKDLNSELRKPSTEATSANSEAVCPVKDGGATPSTSGLPPDFVKDEASASAGVSAAVTPVKNGGAAPSNSGPPPDFVKDEASASAGVSCPVENGGVAPSNSGPPPDFVKDEATASSGSPGPSSTGPKATEEEPTDRGHWQWRDWHQSDQWSDWHQSDDWSDWREWHASDWPSEWRATKRGSRGRVRRENEFWRLRHPENFPRR